MNQLANANLAFFPITNITASFEKNNTSGEEYPPKLNHLAFLYISFTIFFTFSNNTVFAETVPIWSQLKSLHMSYVIASLKKHLGKLSYSKSTWGFPHLATHSQQPPKIHNWSLLIMRSTRGASLLDFPLLVLKNNPSLQPHEYFEGMGEYSSRSGGIWEASIALCLHYMFQWHSYTIGEAWGEK